MNKSLHKIIEERELRDEWEKSEVCDELKYNLEGLSRGEEVEYRQKNVADWWLSRSHSTSILLIGSIQEMIKEFKTDERKVSVFGKGMDSWEARGYDEKKLVNAVIDDIISSLKKELNLIK